MSHDQSDRRQHPRLQQQLPLSVAANGYDFSTTTQNISCAGAYCTIKKYVPPFTKLKVKMSLPCPKKRKPEEVECSGVVVRTDDESNGYFNIAIFFNEIKENPRKKIADYVHSCLAGPAFQS
jgi:hypothetical protein